MKKLLAVLISAGLYTVGAFAQAPASAPVAPPSALAAPQAPAASAVGAPAPKAKTAKSAKSHNHHAKAMKAPGKKVAQKKTKKHKVAA